MNKIKIIILPIFCSSLLFSSNSVEYSVGINDKLGYLGLFSKSWITEKNNKESKKTNCNDDNLSEEKDEVCTAPCCSEK